MRTGDIIETNRAIQVVAKYAHLEDDKYKLCFKLDRLARRLSDDVKAFETAQNALIEKYADESVLISSETEVAGVTAYQKPTEQEEEKRWLYFVSPEDYDAKYKGVAGIAEMRRGKIQVSAQNMNAYIEEVNAILEEEVTPLATDKIKLSLFSGILIPQTDENGKKNPTLSDCVVAMREFIEEDE